MDRKGQLYDGCGVFVARKLTTAAAGCGAWGGSPSCGGVGWNQLPPIAEVADVVWPGQPARFHDLRHTCVSLLLEAGVPPHVVREIVGHSAIDVTMTIYAHASLDEKRRALDRLGDQLA
jgi:hypothetical protein